ncbi:hypothetical protein QFC20_006926 [Naganishia adeliensis]|uniref:Uncharacterized protein n=1 Tax=Naganishia adeliensis TaxID=92952 RepID=A0ACC2V4K4_9TREE|nr:hypothetical protein QFC20_006926 [Naganishia adeliensis]
MPSSPKAGSGGFDPRLNKVYRERLEPHFERFWEQVEAILKGDSPEKEKEVEDSEDELVRGFEYSPDNVIETEEM